MSANVQPADPAPADVGGRGAGVFVGFVLIGAAVSVALGVYGKVHTPTERALTTLGFSTLIDMKAWLATVVAVLAFVQLFSALRIYGRIGRQPAGRGITVTHRVSGVLALLVSLPVAFACLWSLGFGAYDSRALVHSLLGCAFYGIFVTKMLSLKSSRVPGWAIPLLGGLLFVTIISLWLTSSLWYFTQT